MNDCKVMTAIKTAKDNLKHLKTKHKDFFKKADAMIAREETRLKKIIEYIGKLNNKKQVQNDRVSNLLLEHKDEFDKEIASSTKATIRMIKLKYLKLEFKSTRDFLAKCYSPLL